MKLRPSKESVMTSSQVKHLGLEGKSLNGEPLKDTVAVFYCQ